MEDLKSYRVSLHEDEGDKFTVVFDCQAEDADRAEEQALDMYPNAEIINVIEWDQERSR